MDKKDLGKCKTCGQKLEYYDPYEEQWCAKCEYEDWCSVTDRYKGYEGSYAFLYLYLFLIGSVFLMTIIGIISKITK